MTSKTVCWVGVVILAIHVFLIVWEAWIHSPNLDEPPHLACGLAAWRERRFDYYSVNPHLVRMVAALPILFTDARLPKYMTQTARPEFRYGSLFILMNPENYKKFFFHARLACIPFTILGGVTCFLWATKLFGKISGLVALIFWSFSPNVLAWGSTIGPDVGAASFGILTCYQFWKWLRRPTFRNMIISGIVLGLCEMTKMTWIILYGIFPVIWLIWLFCKRKRLIQYWITGKSLLGILVLSLYIVNTFYLYDGSLRTLGCYEFKSELFSHVQKMSLCGLKLKYLPLPFPSDYVNGIDLQRVDFESGNLDSYLLGKWSEHKGWWYYYLVGMVVKVPVGTLVLLFLSCLLLFFKSGRRANGIDLVVLLLPALALFVFVSSQTGFSRHFRYVLPAFPFFFVFLSSVFVSGTVEKLRFLPYIAVLWMVISSLVVFPHSLSYFNEFAGGPENGSRFMLDSAIDWQQNLYLLESWQKRHPERKPLFVDYDGNCPPEDFGLKYDAPPIGSKGSSDETKSPPSGWYAVSVHNLFHYSKDYSYLRNKTPLEKIGYSIYIFKIGEDETRKESK